MGFPLLQGARLSFPVCDLRPLLKPAYRFHFLSDLASIEPDHTHVKGFGYATERAVPAHAARHPWREHETVYFDCSRALSLPLQRLGNVNVSRTVRRLYVDDQALARFDIGCYIDPRNISRQDSASLDEDAVYFLKAGLRIGPPGHRKTTGYPQAFTSLLNRFVRMTTPYRRFRTKEDVILECQRNLCFSRRPLLLIVAAGDEADLPGEAIPLDPAGNLFGQFRTIKWGHRRRSISVDTVYVIYSPHYVRVARGPPFNHLRWICNHILWLHADVEVLRGLLRHWNVGCLRRRALTSSVVTTADSLLGVLGRPAGVDHQLLGAFVQAAGNPWEDRIRRVTDVVTGSGWSVLWPDVKHSLKLLRGSFEDAATAVDGLSKGDAARIRSALEGCSLRAEDRAVLLSLWDEVSKLSVSEQRLNAILAEVSRRIEGLLRAALKHHGVKEYVKGLDHIRGIMKRETVGIDIVDEVDVIRATRNKPSHGKAFDRSIAKLGCVTAFVVLPRAASLAAGKQ